MATVTHQGTGDLLDQAASVVDQALNALVVDAAHDAEVCGCPGCRGKAVDAAEWRAKMLSVAEAA